MYSKSTAHISSYRCHFLTARVLVYWTYKDRKFGYGRTKCMVTRYFRDGFPKQSKLNFLNQLHPQIAFICHFLTHTATWRPKHTILTQGVNAIRKNMTNTGILAPSLGGEGGGSEYFLFTLGGFLNKREYSGADWLDLFICLLGDLCSHYQGCDMTVTVHRHFVISEFTKLIEQTVDIQSL